MAIKLSPTQTRLLTAWATVAGFDPWIRDMKTVRALERRGLLGRWSNNLYFVTSKARPYLDAPKES